MGADKLAENNPNAPKIICPIHLPKPKILGFQWKKASSASVVRALIQGYMSNVLKNIILIKHQTLPKQIWSARLLLHKYQTM